MPSTTCLQFLSEPLPAAAQPPSLMPFHIAYSGPAPISTYFLPRPEPIDPHAPSAEPLLLSTFRGRQVVGQTLRVPDGYSGVVLRVPPPPPPVASRAGGSSSMSAALDPAALFSTPDVAPEEAADASKSGLRRSPRKRMAPAAAARPPPAKRARVAAKKFQLDDSDSESDNEPSAAPVALEAIEATPSLVSVATALTTPSLSAGSVVTPLGSVAGDEVVIAAAEAEVADRVQETLEIAETAALDDGPVVLEAVLEIETTVEATLAVASPPSVDALVEVHPADEPYKADQLLPSSATAAVDGSSTRLITPLSTFETIALWTADDAVDPGRDELYRCLGKGGWLEMSRIIHDEEDDD